MEKIVTINMTKLSEEESLYLSLKEESKKIQQYAVDNGVAVVSDKFYDGFKLGKPENCITFSQVRTIFKKEALNSKLKKVKLV